MSSFNGLVMINVIIMNQCDYCEQCDYYDDCDDATPLEQTRIMGRTK